MKTQISNMKTTLARVLLFSAWATMTLAAHPHAAAQTVELFRNAGGDVKDFDGTKPESLVNGKVYRFKNTSKMKIIKLEFTFDPVDDATGTSLVNNVGEKKLLNTIKKVKNGDNKVIGLTFEGDVPIPRGASFAVDLSGFGQGKKITMTATLGKQLVGLGASAAPATGISGVTSLSVSASGLLNGNINPSNLRVELSTVCLEEALATTSATSVVSGDDDSKFVSFLLPAGLDEGQYYISISDSKDGPASFESANCSAVTVAK
jgi:hypothetical protein